MIDRVHSKILFAALTLISGPLVVLFYGSLEGVKGSARVLITTGSVLILCTGVLLLTQYRQHLPKIAQLFVITTAGTAMVFGYLSDDVFQTNSSSVVYHYLFGIGKILLIGLTAAVIVLPLLPYNQSSKVSTRPSLKLVCVHYALPIILFAALVLSIVCWSQTHTKYIYYWDYRNYWEKTEELYELMASGDLGRLATLIRDYYSADYSMFPAVAPAFLSLPFGFPNRIVYALSITLAYVVPAFFMIAYLSERLFREPIESSYRAYGWAVSALAPLVGVPLFLGVALLLMPDIGGVVLVVSGMIIAFRVTVLISEPGHNTGWRDLPPALVRNSLALGLLLCAMFLFRRWYVFAAVGIVVSGMLLVSYDLWSINRARLSILIRALSAVSLIGTGALPLMAWVMFDWAATLEDHNYFRRYSGWAQPLATDAWRFVLDIGLVAPISVLVLILMLRTLLDHRLVFILLCTSLISCILFLQISSPSLQHYYLLMPLLGAGLAVISQVLIRHYGLIAGFALPVVLLLGGGFRDAAPNGFWMRAALPGFSEWKPKQQSGGPGLKRIGEWLLSPSIRRLKFCLVASSGRINQSILRELWQIAPSIPKSYYSGRMIYVHDVDSSRGPPNKTFRRCDIVLVGWPPQTHLRSGEQYSVEILAEELFYHKGVGLAFERLPDLFVLDEHTEVIAFRRIRELSEAEYEDLVERFYRKKAAHAAKMDIDPHRD